MKTLLILLLVLGGQDDEGIAVLTEVLRESDDPEVQIDILGGIRDALKGRRGAKMPGGWPEVARKLGKSARVDIRFEALALSITFGDKEAFRKMRAWLADRSASRAMRVKALDALLGAKDPELPAALIRHMREPGLRGPAIRALAAFGDPKTAGRILAVYPDLGATERREALGVLVSRVAWAGELRAAFEKGAVSSTQFTAAQVRQLRNLKDKEITRWTEEVWGNVRALPEDLKREIARVKRLLGPAAMRTADAPAGRATFARLCAQCHTLYGAGGAVGPDLTGSNRADPDYLLQNVVDPNALIGQDYMAYKIKTRDDRFMTGLITKRDSSSITIRTEDETIVLPADEVASTEPTNVSIMPMSLLDGLKDAEVRNLVAYLRTRTQVPMLATERNVGDFFNKTDLAGWDGNTKLWSVENGEIVGSSPGIRRNEFLRSQMMVGDFRLTVETKLTPNSGNSGVQFRSRTIKDGFVAGYQADMGVTYWGTLYEERGRGQIWKKSGNRFLKSGEWNTYEIQAVGSRIRTWLNGNLCVDLDDPDGARRGIIAFQLHAGKPMEVRFRNLRLELNPQDKFEIHSFERKQLSEEFYCEGATFGDFNRDGKMDIVSGPFWYAGPEFSAKTEIYEPKPFDKLRYSKNFFAFVHDFNKDTWPDILVIGFPGQDASWFENPKGKDGHWTRHKVFDIVDNESPVGKPELIFHTGGVLGWAEPDWSDTTKPWTFHPLSGKLGYGRFTHGLGYGDVNGDGRMDILEHSGWWEQPADRSKLWTKHAVAFGRGGAQMYAFDVDGDGDNDVVTSLWAHGYGLAWFENIKKEGKVTLQKHLIMGAKPEDNRYGVRFSQLHAVAVVDMDGDGVMDIVTGKRHWAHGPKGDPEPTAPAVSYWFRTVRGSDGVDFVPYRIDDDSGVGTQLVTGDVNGDGRPDVVVGNKKGTFVLLHKARKVSREEWTKAQPKPRDR